MKTCVIASEVSRNQDGGERPLAPAAEPPPHQRSVTSRLCRGDPLNEQRGLYNRLHSSTLISAVIGFSDSPEITVLTISQANVHVNNYNVRTKHTITKARGIRGCTEVFNLTLKSNPNVCERK